MSLSWILGFFLFGIGNGEFLEPISLFGSEVHTRIKREANVTHLDDPKGALLKCNNALLNNMWINTPGNQSSGDPSCKAQMEAFDCFDKAPPSQLKDLLRSGFEMASLMCSAEGKKYVSSYSCLQQVLPPVNTTCDDVCKEYGNTSVAILTSVHYSDFGTIFYEADPSIVTKRVGEVCKLFQCKATCTIPAISSKCGKQIADTSAKVTKATLNQCISAYRILGVWKEMPAECKTIL